MIYPGATPKPVANHGGPIARIQGLVLHVQEGNNSLFNYFNNPSSQVSSHFWVSKTGVLEQYVDTTLIAWAEAAGNPYYLSIESEGFQTEPLSPQQQSVIANLLQWMNETFGTPLVGPVPHGSYGFTQHCNPDGTPDPSWGGHVCPGTIRLNQMPTIIALAHSFTPQPTEAQMGAATAVVTPEGKVKVYMPSPNGHLLEFTRDPSVPTNVGSQNSVIDITAQIGGSPPYLVAT